MFINNLALNGASVWQNNCPNVTHTSNIFEGGTAAQGCGGIELNQGRTSISGCYFSQCSGAKGGAIYFQVGSTPHAVGLIRHLAHPPPPRRDELAGCMTWSSLVGCCMRSSTAASRQAGRMLRAPAPRRGCWVPAERDRGHPGQPVRRLRQLRLRWGHVQRDQHQ